MSVFSITGLGIMQIIFRAAICAALLFSLSGCAVVSVASAAVTVASTAVSVGVTAGSMAVGAVSTVGGAIIGDDDEDEDE